MASSYSSTVSKTYASGNVDENTKKNYLADQNAKFQESADTTAWGNYVKNNINYSPSANVQQAYANMNAMKDATKPFEQELSDIYSQIKGRPAFSYNMNADALYQNYKNQYVTLGQNAMRDTMGQAAALTGGYGSSYSQTAAQQTYQAYLQELNNKLPELYDRALNAYNAEGDRLNNLYSLASNQYDNAWNKYQDASSFYQNERNADQSAWSTRLGTATDLYTSGRQFDYQNFVDQRAYNSQEYWNQLNSAQTTESQTTSWTESGGGSGGGYSGGNDSSSNVNTSGVYWTEAQMKQHMYNLIAAGGSSSDIRNNINENVKNGWIDPNKATWMKNLNTQQLREDVAYDLSRGKAYYG